MARASIIVLCYNGLEEATRPCIESIYRNTSLDDFELVVVDNASSDGTPDYLRQLERTYSNVVVQLNEVNKGYAGGNNDGLRLARGSHLVLLNNDTLVPPGWLGSLLSLLESDDKVGMVGPVTNSAGNEQCIELPALDEHNFEEVATHYIARQQGVWFTTAKLGFFCVAMRHDLLRQVGYLDEAFGIGMFEDDDYCARVLAQGYRLAVTESCFVYHKGSVSFKKLTGDTYQAIFEKNRELYFEKHHVLWTYSDIARALWTKLNTDLRLCHSDSSAAEAALERIRVRTTGLANIIFQLGKIEEGRAQICGKPFNELALAEKNRQLMEISDWATSLKGQLDQHHEELNRIRNSKWFVLYRLLHRAGLH